MPGPDDRIPDPRDVDMDALFNELLGGGPSAGAPKSGMDRISAASVQAKIERFLETEITHPKDDYQISIRSFLGDALPDMLAGMGEKPLRGRVGELSEALVAHADAAQPGDVPGNAKLTLNTELSDVKKNQGILADVKGYFAYVMEGEETFGLPASPREAQEQQEFRTLMGKFMDTTEDVMRQALRLERNLGTRELD